LSVVFIGLANDSDLVKALIEAGDNIDHQDKDGNTALIHASLQENFDLIKILIQAGTDINKKNHDNKDFFDIIPNQVFKDRIYSNLHDIQWFIDAKKFFDGEIL